VTTALAIRNLQLRSHQSGQDRILVDGVNLSLEPGDTLAIVGESGAGKSLTARATIGLLPPSVRVACGEIRIGDMSILNASDAALSQMRGSTVSYIPQDPLRALNPVRRIDSLFDELLTRHSISKAKDRQQHALRCLDRVGLSAETLRRYAHELSGGMRQRVLIAMAIAGNPLLIIADEPTTALDTTVQAEIIDLLHDLTMGSTALLLITHDLAVAANLCRQAVVMRSGKTIEEGLCDELLRNPTTDYTRQLIVDSLIDTLVPSANSSNMVPQYR